MFVVVNIFFTKSFIYNISQFFIAFLFIYRSLNRDHKIVALIVCNNNRIFVITALANRKLRWFHIEIYITTMWANAISPIGNSHILLLLKQ